MWRLNNRDGAEATHSGTFGQPLDQNCIDTLFFLSYRVSSHYHLRHTRDHLVQGSIFGDLCNWIMRRSNRVLIRCPFCLKPGIPVRDLVGRLGRKGHLDPENREVCPVIRAQGIIPSPADLQHFEDCYRRQEEHVPPGSGNLHDIVL